MSTHDTKRFPVSIFYSYADADLEFQQKLEKHLAVLRREGSISEWHRRQVIAGAEKTSIVNDHLDEASLILLLISPDFLASDYCYGVGMQKALEKQAAGTARVMSLPRFRRAS